MAYSKERRKDIYERTSGYCHLCRKKLSFSNYGKRGFKGNWEVEHSVPRAKGGTDRLNNLYAACIDCNREKKTTSTRTARRWNGRSRAPLSRDARESARDNNTLSHGAAGATIGGLLGGPFGAMLGGVLGAIVGNNKDPDD
ncbi:MAG: HNH endonuclease [Leptospirales bacterium]|nr:HNH endonuclease [Leptospirales bacterium]